MNRIDQLFADLRARGAKSLMPFITAGDPDIETTGALLHAMQNAGAGICEIGFPFSDPIADGPVVQASMSYALDRGIRTQQIFDMIAAERSKLDIGLVAMVSFSIVHRIGPEAFVKRCADAGIDGLIIPDLSLDESESVCRAAADAGLICSFLIAPTTPIDRARELAKASSGFIYMLARAGITGERKTLPPDLPDRVAALREVTDLPIAIGFGVSNAEHVRDVVAVADGAIVGSAIVRRIDALHGKPKDEVVAQIEPFIRSLVDGLTSQPAAR